MRPLLPRGGSPEAGGPTACSPPQTLLRESNRLHDRRLSFLVLVHSHEEVDFPVVVQAIVQGHSGEIMLENSPAAGLEARVPLPVTRKCTQARSPAAKCPR